MGVALEKARGRCFDNFSSVERVIGKVDADSICRGFADNATRCGQRGMDDEGERQTLASK
jgi:hypothetical protein